MGWLTETMKMDGLWLLVADSATDHHQQNIFLMLYLMIKQWQIVIPLMNNDRL